MMNLNFPNILTKLFCFDRSKLILLFLFFLWNCDSGCVSADSIGSSDVSAVDVDANPAEYVTTIVGTSTSTRVIVPDISYDYLADYNSREICDSIWSKMNLTYNASYNYSIAYTGSVESCSTAPSAPSSAKLILTADMINGVDMSDEDDETKISSFNAAFSTSTSYNFSTAAALEGNKFNCLGKEVIIYEHFGGVYADSNYYTSSDGKDDAVGDVQSYTCSDSSGCTINTRFADISMVEIPRGCTVTFYQAQNGVNASNYAGIKISVPVVTPTPYLYIMPDYRFDSTGLESQCGKNKGWGINDCITGLKVVQDPGSYELCDNSKKTYLWQHYVGGAEMIVSGTLNYSMIWNAASSGSNVAGDRLSSVAVPEGCQLILTDGPSENDKDAVDIVRPHNRTYDSEVFAPALMCLMATELWKGRGYEGQYVGSMTESRCTGNVEYFHDQIRSIKIENNDIYQELSVFAKKYSDEENYKPEFYKIAYGRGVKQGALYFDGISNFMISDNIANNLRQDSGYTILVSASPSCDGNKYTSTTDDDCDSIAKETESRMIFAANQDDKDKLGDYLAIGPDGILEFAGEDLGTTSYYNESFTIIITRNVDNVKIELDEDTFYLGDDIPMENNRKVKYFSLGQEWDFEITPSQFFQGYINHFALFSDAATEEDINDVVSLLGSTNMIYSTFQSELESAQRELATAIEKKDSAAQTEANKKIAQLAFENTNGGAAGDIYEPICNDDFGLNDIQIAYGTDINTDFTIATSDIVTEGLFNMPDGVATGDHFYFRVKNSRLSCDYTTDTNFALYSTQSGVITVSLKEEKDAKGLITGLQPYIVDPIVDIFDCKDVNEHGEPTHCGGFYNTFYTQIVIGTEDNPSLFSVLINIFLQFLVIMMGINFMFGLEKMTSWALVGRLLKIGTVYLLVSPDSWEFFRDNVIVFVRDVPLQIGEFLTDNLAVADNIASTSQEKASMFDMLDNVSGIFLSSDVHAKIWGLLFTSPMGALMVMLLYYSIFIFFKGMITALIQYVVIILLISLAIILAPFFIIFALMPITSQFFSKWLDMIIGSAFKLMLLSMTVILFSYFIYAYAYNMFNYAVCWKTVLYCCTFLPFQFSLLQFFAPASFDYRRFGIDEVTATGPDFIEVCCFFIIVILFYKFLDISESLSDKLAGGISIAGVGKDFTKTMSAMPGQAANLGDKAVGKMYDKAVNEKGAYNRKKTNLKKDLKNATIGKVDNLITGKVTKDQKAAAKGMDDLFSDMKKEYASEGKDPADFEDDLKDRARDKLKNENKFSDKQIDQVLGSKKFNRKLKRRQNKIDDSKDDI